MYLEVTEVLQLQENYAIKNDLYSKLKKKPENIMKYT